MKALAIGISLTMIALYGGALAGWWVWLGRRAR